MNPHAPAPTSLGSIFASVWRNKSLIRQMTKRDVVGRYKGSVMGVLWSFVNPIFLLITYTLVFSVVFKARWGSSIPETKAEFAVLVFVGMILHGILAETLVRAPHLVLTNVNYVKKVVFPLETLPLVAVLTSVFHALVSSLVLLTALLLLNGFLHLTVLFFPLVLAPLVILSLGFAWILASLGVYLRDVAQPMGLLTTVLLFASPVFYPLTALPAYIQPWILLNPLTFVIEQARLTLIFGRNPDFLGLALYSAVAFGVAWLGYIWFQKTRKGFANVL